MPLKLRKYCRTMEATGDDLVNVVEEKEEISEDLSVAEPLIPYTDSDSDEEYPDLEERFERLDQINNKVQNESLRYRKCHFPIAKKSSNLRFKKNIN